MITLYEVCLTFFWFAVVASLMGTGADWLRISQRTGRVFSIILVFFVLTEVHHDNISHAALLLFAASLLFVLNQRDDTEVEWVL